jgi:hypothetical protein
MKTGPKVVITWFMTVLFLCSIGTAVYASWWGILLKDVGAGVTIWFITEALQNARTEAKPAEPSGFPSGWQMSECGCYGPQNAVTFNEPACAKGIVVPRMCSGRCRLGDLPYAHVCY